MLAGVMARVPACPADTPSAFFGADPALRFAHLRSGAVARCRLP